MGKVSAQADKASAPISVCIVDDHGLLVESMASWITANAADFKVVSQATTWSGALSDAAFPADLVLMDYHLTEAVSVEARTMTCKAAGAKIIVMSAFGEAELLRRTEAAGVDGFFVKSTPMSEVVNYARGLFGRKPVDVASSDIVREAAENTKPALSKGELEALILVCRGLSIKEVGIAMNCGYETAKTYIRRVREKYARAGRPASRRADLVRRAAEDGYLT